MIGARRPTGALRAATFVVASAALVAADACVVTDPPGDLERLPERRPTIVRGSVVPSTTSVISRWPGLFLVPVEISSPSATIYWAAFIDYNPVHGDGAVAWEFDSASNGTRIRQLQIPVGEPPGRDRCHTIEIVVGVSPRDRSDPRFLHTPVDPPGGDSVTWFFNPNGDAAGCPTLDAGIDAAMRDAETGPP